MQITSELVQRYARIAVYYLSGVLTSHGVTVSASNTELYAGVAMFAANLAWTLWGTRLNAKLAEIAKAPEVKVVVMQTQAQANAVPDNKVVSQ